MSRRLIALAVMSAVVAACAPSGPDDTGFAAAAAIASGVRAENVMPLVERLAREHTADAKVSCDGYTPEDRFPACALSHDAAIALVKESFEALGLMPQTIALGEGPGATHNVIGEWRGTTLPDEVVVVAAHPDAFFAGADDNSSGVAAMIEAARALVQRRYARTLRFAAFDLEEYGSVGSTRYVEAGMARDVVFAIVLDAVGFASSARGSQTSPPGIPLGDVGDALLAVGNTASRSQTQRMVALANRNALVKTTGILGPGDALFPLSGALARSDHGAFWFRGIPAVLLTDSANYRNEAYHREGDVPETLNASFLEGVTRAVAAWAALFAEVTP